MTSSKNSSTRPKRTHEESRNASDALYYEIWMFNEMVKSLLTQPAQPGNPQYNALVESFVQHTRILIEFFYPTNNTKADSDTMIASEFFADENQWGKYIPEWLKEIRTRANKLLAHLSYNRVLRYKDDKGWPYPVIRENLNNLFNDFFKNVPPDRIGEKLRSYKVPPVNIIETPNSAMIASTGTAYSPGVAVTRKLIK